MLAEIFEALFRLIIEALTDPQKAHKGESLWSRFQNFIYFIIAVAIWVVSDYIGITICIIIDACLLILMCRHFWYRIKK